MAIGPTPATDPRLLNENDLLEAVRDAASDDYDVLGFLGKHDESTFVYLAREHATHSLVALKLESQGSAASGEPSFSIDVARELDSSIPDVDAVCSRCKSKLRRWARYCTQCGLDVSGVSASSGSSHSRATLLMAVRAAAGDEYEVLGEMARKEGGGLVYFARENSSGKIVALRLNREGEEDYSLNVTRVLKPVPKPRDSTDRSRISLVHRVPPEAREASLNAAQKYQRREAAPAPGPEADRSVGPKAQPSLSYRKERQVAMALVVVGVFVIALLVALVG